jgi:CHAT domain-containing protein
MSHHGVDEIRAARQELDDAILEIRTVPGFEGFLATPTFDDVAAAADRAPIVYLAATLHGGLALVVQGESVEHVPLDELTAESLRERVERHLGIYETYRHSPDAGRSAWAASLDDLCAWLWKTAMGQVLEKLAGATEATLVPGGLLGMLPLHAAWTPDDRAPTGRRHALDAMPLSYAPNARSLSAARARADETPLGRLLVVSEPRPVSGARLPCAALEADVAAAAFPDSPRVLPGGAATHGNFVASVATADVLHLACHGFADLAEPLESGLRLAGDRAITLRDLMAMELRVRLAVLSACETSLPGTELPDEVVALPTGLLQAGVAGVVASMWAVPDRATAMLMTDFYRRWRWQKKTPADALRDAQCWLRDTTNEEKRAVWREGEDEGEDERWLPPTVAQAFLEATAYAEPEARDYAAIPAWGAFMHVGA